MVGKAPPSRPPRGLHAGLLACVAGRVGGLPLVVPPGLQQPPDLVRHHPVAGGQQVYHSWPIFLLHGVKEQKVKNQ